MTDILIIGAGPAGLTAAIYARRAEKSVLVLERESFGGQINYSPKIENYPGFASVSGAELADTFVSQALELGAEVDIAEVTAIRPHDGVFTVETDSGCHDARAVILATGAKHRHLGVPGEEELIGDGISFCATCDGAFYAEKDVLVIGGGNSAAAEALQLSDICATVTMVQNLSELTCEKTSTERIAQKKNIRVITDAKVLSFYASGEKRGVRYLDAKDTEQTVEADGIFIAVGLAPDNASFADVANLENGYIAASDACHTSTPGLFTAGDCRTKAVRQITTACADGTVAALAAVEYLNG